jgi:cytochrome P450
MGRVRMPRMELFMPNEPNFIKQVMVTDAKKFPKHHVIEELLKPLLGESIFTTNGQIWETQREMMDPAFVHTRLEKVFPLMNDAIQEMVARISKYKEDEAIDIDVDMTHITADIIFRTIMSTKINADEAEKIYTAFNKFQEITQRIMVFRAYMLPTYFMQKKSLREAEKIRGILSPIIKARYDEFYSDNRKSYDDILDSLLNAKHEKTGKVFGYEELVDHISMLFLAGHETSASALTWSLYLLASCPDIQKQLHDEINQLTNGGAIEFAHIRKLDFTKNVFNEALRLYPPVGFFLREATETTCVFNKMIKAGSAVMVSPWLLHRNRKQWIEPDAFAPERFDPKNQMHEQCKEAIKNAYIPFGAGPRICIGKGFALQESAMVLANLIKNFEFKMKPGHIPEATGRVTVRAENGVKLLITKRANSSLKDAA